MVKIIIELRKEDIDGNKIDNSKDIEKINNFCAKFWNCEIIEVKK